MADRSSFKPVLLSLRDLLGEAYLDAVCRARGWLAGEAAGDLQALAARRVDFYPTAFQARLEALLPQAGTQVVAPLKSSGAGAATRGFAAATKTTAAPLSALGWYRLGEDGRLYVASKSEHYHTPLGHGFPGYELVQMARALGIPNATHNNTRGYVTRRLEQELVRTANGLPPDRPLVTPALGCVLNLETGSLAMEAALKMVLARFYRTDAQAAKPPYSGRVPVIVVVGNDDREVTGNYHGTTILTQAMRGMWPELARAASVHRLFRLAVVRPNLIEDLDEVFSTLDSAPYKVAGFFHEIVMMNYGARRLTPEFLRHAYQLCQRRDVPTIVDEIQSCMWYDGHYLFRHDGLQPDFVAIGKGFPGGEYPASRLIFNRKYDCLPQFGALVTNGQEELASLAYLVTMAWAQANGSVIAALGAAIEQRFRELARRYEPMVAGYEGQGHLSALSFRDPEVAKGFAFAMNRAGFDISVQSYKVDCPPVALTKLPLIADEALIDAFLGTMQATLEGLS